MFPRFAARLVLALVALFLGACASNNVRPVIPVAHVPADARGRAEYGLASWHGPSRFSRQARTASGKRWTNGDLIAAHRTHRLGTILRVTHVKSGQQITVQVIDRGPYVRGRIIDLSPRAAEALGFRSHGVAEVKIEPIDGSG